LGAHPFDDTSWSESWRQFFMPARVSDRVVVRPSWTEELPDDGPALVLVIDPGMAFGTGTHETTRMCLQAVDEYLLEHPGSTFLDVGCGSGILTMAADQLDAGRVLGLDNDPEAIRVAGENWVRNRLGDLAEAPFVATPLGEIEDQFDLVVANMLSGILLDLRSDLIRVTGSGGRLVLSGILESELERFVAQFASAPVEIERQQVTHGWAALWCVVKR
jgi:ribosomal protein L11 methyltransferase